MRYIEIKVLLTVSPFRPSFSPQPYVYPRETLRFPPRYSIRTTHSPLSVLTPFAATHTQNAPVTSFPATHTKTPSRKSFPCHTYENIGGWGPITVNLCRPSPQRSIYLLTPLLRYSYKLFVASKKINSFTSRQIRTLSAKYPGWGALS